jgi:hypothetical protein
MLKSIHIHPVPGMHSCWGDNPTYWSVNPTNSNLDTYCFVSSGHPIVRNYAYNICGIMLSADHSQESARYLGSRG